MLIKRDLIKNKLAGENTAILEINGEIIPLPQIALTSTDINYGEEYQRKFLKSFNFPHMVHETRELWFNGKKLKKIDEFVLSKEAQVNKLNWLNIQISKAKNNGDPHVFIYTPVVSKKVVITTDFADLIIDVEIKSDLNFVTIPIPLLKEDLLERWVSDKCSQIRKEGKEPLILIRQDEDEIIFKRRIDLAKRYKAGINVMFISNKYQENIIMLAYSYEDNFIRILSNVPYRINKKDNDAILPLGFLVADIICSRVGIGGKIDSEKEITNARRLDTTTLGYITINQYKEDHPDGALDSCPPDLGNKIEDLAEEYYGSLRVVFRIHDAFELYNFINRVSFYIKVGTLEKHLKGLRYNKTGLKTFLTKDNTLKYFAGN